MSPMPQITALDLSRADTSQTFRHDHPDIPDGAHALAVYDGRLVLGQFSRAAGRLRLYAAPVGHDFCANRFQAVWLIENVEALETTNPQPVSDDTWLGMLPEEVELYEIADALFDNGWYARPATTAQPGIFDEEDLEEIRDTIPEPIGPYTSKAEAAEAVCRKLGRLPAQARVQDRARQLAAG